jgi:RsiW-degrading membrane proteinase PrsW (M82 family)
MLWTNMMDFLKSWFVYDGLGWKLILVAIGLSLAFGIIWLLGYRPPFFKKLGLWLWPVMVISSFLTMLAITFIQIPAQYYLQQLMTEKLGIETIYSLYLLVSIPSVLISGLVQEAVKSLPVVIWWWNSGRTLTPKMGLMIGAAAGAGFGILEAIWSNGNTFVAGWTTQAITQYGFDGLSPFWVRFFAVGFHIATSALVGYGLTKRKWWLYYLIAAVLHGVLNYSSILSAYFTYLNQVTWFRNVQLEIYIAVIAAIVTAWALYLRWRKEKAEIPPPVEIPELPAELITPNKPIMPVDFRTPPGG